MNNNKKPQNQLQELKSEFTFFNILRVFIVFSLLFGYELISQTLSNGSFTLPNLSSSDFVMKMIFMMSIAIAISKIYSYRVGVGK